MCIAELGVIKNMKNQKKGAVHCNGSKTNNIIMIHEHAKM